MAKSTRMFCVFVWCFLSLGRGREAPKLKGRKRSKHRNQSISALQVHQARGMISGRLAQEAPGASRDFSQVFKHGLLGS